MSTVNSVDLRLAEGLRFEARTGGGHAFTIDSAHAGVEASAPSPVEYVLGAAGGCMAMDTISILRKMRQDVTAYDVHLDGPRADEHPRVLTSITMTHTVRGPGVAAANVARALQLSLTRYCPVHAMLAPSVPFTVRYEVTDETTGAYAEGEVVPEAEPAVGA